MPKKPLDIESVQFTNVAATMKHLTQSMLPGQVYREMTHNSIEAIQRRTSDGDATPGLITWMADPEYEEQGIYKLTLMDNGDGMSKEEMPKYLLNINGAGANKERGGNDNYGMGAKLAGFDKHPKGLVYKSWAESKGHQATLVKRDLNNKEEFGFITQQDPETGEEDLVVPLGNEIKKRYRPIRSNGTAVTLLGKSNRENTVRAPKGFTGSKWLCKYLNSRYFELPLDITLRVRVYPTDWESRKNHSGKLEYVKVEGQKAVFDKHSISKGVIQTEDTKQYWWAFGKNVPKEVVEMGATTGRVGILHQGEVYYNRNTSVGKQEMSHFQIYSGRNRIAIIIEPDITKHTDIQASPVRDAVYMDGGTDRDKNKDPFDGWIELWAEEFCKQTPDIIKEICEESLSTDGEGDFSAKNRRARRYKSLTNRVTTYPLSKRYKKDANGEKIHGGEGEEIGRKTRKKKGEKREEKRHDPNKKKVRRKRTQTRTVITSNPNNRRGIKAMPKKQRLNLPDFVWVEGDDGLEGNFAQIQGNAITGNKVLIDRDWVYFQEFVKELIKSSGAENDENQKRIITLTSEEEFETQLTECIIYVRDLMYAPGYSEDKVSELLTPEALTTAASIRDYQRSTVKKKLRAKFNAKKGA